LLGYFFYPGEAEGLYDYFERTPSARVEQQQRILFAICKYSKNGTVDSSSKEKNIS
jgi:hypothetical protein